MKTFSTRIALSNFASITKCAWWSTSIRSSVVNACIILTSWCTTFGTSTSITFHICLYTFTRTTFVGCTCLKWTTWWSTIFPVATLQLIITTWIWIDIPLTFERPTARFNLTNTCKAFIINSSSYIQRDKKQHRNNQYIGLHFPLFFNIIHYIYALKLLMRKR